MMAVGAGHASTVCRDHDKGSDAVRRGIALVGGPPPGFAVSLARYRRELRMPSGRISSLTPEGDTIDVALEGELVYPVPAKIREAVDTAIMDRHPRLVRLDLAKVSWVDSSGFGLLVRIANHAAKAGAAIRVEHVTKAVRGKLAVLGLLEVLGVAPDLEDHTALPS
jgi:anti-anti-sigma factor